MTLAEVFRQEGRQEARQEEKKKTLYKVAIKLLTKRFGKLTDEIKNKISQLDIDNLEIIIDGIFEYNNLEDVKKYI